VSRGATRSTLSDRPCRCRTIGRDLAGRPDHLRSILGQVELDELLVKPDEINQHLQRIIDQVTDPWRVKVTLVEVKDVELPESMRRAIARQAEAERALRAKVIHAQGEFEAAESLGAADTVQCRGRCRGSCGLRRDRNDLRW
jgi:SPFH domain / Band 7 family